MEEEPGELRSSEQPELLSLIIGGEEATQDGSDPGEDGDLANGHGEEEEPVRSPGTSYWSITEGPDRPLLLSPAPGPCGQKPRVQRASRPGLSRIPGRDHRRYYHEYWRNEYLMDFDPQRHGMICMVCGSSLATLKLSTIKRHIRQKHPDSLLWSATDKEVIRSGWESHLGLSGGPDAAGQEPLPLQHHDALSNVEPIEHTCAGDPPDPVSPQEPPQQPLSVSPPSVEGEGQEDEPNLSGPPARTLERYLNDSLHAWFRQEFLMEYESEAGRLLCMVCGATLPSLHLDHIKSHVLDTHPNSLVYSSTEKHCVLQAWAQTHEEAENSVQSESDTKDLKLTPEADLTLPQDSCLIGEDGGAGAAQQGPPAPRQPKRRRLRGGDPWRLRLDYLVAYGPRAQGTFCMVCSQVLQETKVSSFRRHIQECHPETTTLSREDREAMAAAWTKDPPSEEMVDPSLDDLAAGRKTKTEDGCRWWDDGGVATPRQGHYPGKDQRRNYQARWKVDYLMDYDCRRHGLICMVCGATLATLKVSTIKRHIQQVHPHSLLFGPDQRQQALLGYSQISAHSDHRLSPQDHAHIEPEALPCSS